MFTKISKKVLMASLFFNFFSSTDVALPEGFIYLNTVDKTIQTSMRYFSSENFIGTKIDGYKANRIIITRQAGQALSKIQKELLQEGYSLVVYDAYRPQKAVNLFVRWGNDAQSQAMKAGYYPDINKAALFKLGYLSKKSGHSRGSTVDLTIIKLGNQLKTPAFTVRTINGKQIPFLDDSTVDMGSSFDLFGATSHHDNKHLPQEYTDRRNYLRSKMVKHGFKTFAKEWWHYTLINEPFPNTYFDFDIE